LKRNPILSFLAGLTVATLIIGVIYWCFLLLTFDLGGGETLNQIDNQQIGQLFISILLLFVAFFYAKKYFKTEKKFAGLGIISLPLLIVFVLTFSIVSQSVLTTKFDKGIWEKSKWKPDDMAKSLVRQKSLIGFTRIQVKEMLGQGFEEYGDANSDRGSIIYLVNNGWTLSVIFQKDKVVETQLRQPMLGV
jgi:energy-coupling factor transporter transmembrane protein EcfT